jgi:hypothetical protein
VQEDEVESFVASLVNYASSLSNDSHPLMMILLAVSFFCLPSNYYNNDFKFGLEVNFELT